MKKKTSTLFNRTNYKTHPARCLTRWSATIFAYAVIMIGLFWAQNAWVALFGFHFVMVTSLLIARPNTPFSVLFKSNHPNWVIVNAILGSSSGVALYLLWPYLGIAESVPTQLETMGLTILTWPAFIVYFSLINPFIEEYFWRIYLGSETKRFYLSDAIYAGYHGLVLFGKTSWLIIALVVSALAFAGWLWRQIAREDSGLLAPVAGHMAADLTILATVYRMCTL